MKVVLVELTLYDRVTPLVSGYLKACLEADSDLYRNVNCTIVSRPVNMGHDTIAKELIDARADVYAFSTYMWNVGLVKSLVKLLRARFPSAQIVLGGPEVMHQAQEYRECGAPIIICNGEGERSFTSLVRTIASGASTFGDVAGLSLAAGAQIVTTQPEARIHDLDEIPSPYLTGVLAGPHTVAMLETNRGCPFKCGFCYWGAATNDRVFAFSEERIRAEIELLCKDGVMFLYIVDANWGMLKRDIDLTRHLADCRSRFGSPHIVYFSAAKNLPARVSEITSILKSARIVTSQPVSLQSMSPVALKKVARENIRLSAFAEVQRSIKKRQECSFVELIWPLPGETLESFRQGVNALCTSDADTIIVYPHVLLKNTDLWRKQEEYGLRTLRVADGSSEADLVVATDEAPPESVLAGMRLFYGLHAVHNTQSLRRLLKFVCREKRLEYTTVFDRFLAYCAGRGSAMSAAWEKSLVGAEYYDVCNYGLFVHMSLHSYRRECEQDIIGFVESQDWLADERARALFELDLLARPYIYSNTPVRPPDYDYKYFAPERVTGRAYEVSLPSATRQMLPSIATELDDFVDGRTSFMVIDHRVNQFPYIESNGDMHAGAYCHGMIEKVDNILPRWRARVINEAQV